MISFKEFLSSQEDRLLAEKAERADKKKRWGEAVRELLELISTWITESDPHQLTEIQIEFATLSSSDGTDGTRDNRLAIAHVVLIVGGVSLQLTPSTREAVWPRYMPGSGSWTGEITMFNGVDKYQLYHFEYVDGKTGWFIRDSKRFEFKPFDRPNFEAALVDLLS